MLRHVKTLPMDPDQAGKIRTGFFIDCGWIKNLSSEELDVLFMPDVVLQVLMKNNTIA